MHLEDRDMDAFGVLMKSSENRPTATRNANFQNGQMGGRKLGRFFGKVPKSSPASSL